MTINSSTNPNIAPKDFLDFISKNKDYMAKIKKLITEAIRASKASKTQKIEYEMEANFTLTKKEK